MGLPEILMFESLNPPSPLLNGQYLFSPPHDHGDVADLDTAGLGSTGMVQQGQIVPYHVPRWTETAMLQSSIIFTNCRRLLFKLVV